MDTPVSCRKYWPDEGDEPPSETELLIRRITRELRAAVDPDGAAEWQAMVAEVFSKGRKRGGNPA